MTTQYTPILALALPVTGELSGTWGDVVNDNITSMVEQAIAGLATINTWSGNGHTLTTADGTTSESRCAMLVLTDTGTALTGAATVICPTASKIYIVKNTSGQSATITTAAGTGIAVPNGETMFVFCDGTNVVQAVTRIASADVDFAKLKGTGAVVVTNILDEDNMASDSATALATQQSIKAYVDSQIAANNDLSEVLANGNTTGGTDLAVSAGDDITFTATSNAIFADNGKAIFGAGSDLQIYHDGTTSKIDGNLSVTNALTLSAGTANGVTYLNGSKVLTSGSALTFDGSALAVTGTLSAGNGISYFNNLDANIMLRVGVGITSTLGTGEGLEFSFTAPTAKILSYNRATSAYKNIFIDALTQSFGISGSEGMRLTSTGLGIGTSSPTAKLGVAGNAAFAGSNGPSGNSQGVRILTTNTSGDGVTIDSYAFGSNGYGPLYLNTGNAGTPVMTLTVAGNVGIGTSSPQHKIDAIGNIRSANSTNTAGQSANIFAATFNSNFGQTDSATFQSVLNNATTGENDLFIKQFNHNSGSTDDIVLKAASGNSGYTALYTADTERMRLDSSGNWLLGQTSSIYSAVGRAAAEINGSLTAIYAMNIGGSNAGYVYHDGTNMSLINYRAGPLFFATNNTERARIDSSGNLLVGGTSAFSPAAGRGNISITGSSSAILSMGTPGDQIGYLFHDGTNMNLFNDKSGYLRFATAGAERMRIDSAGNVGIGTSSPIATQSGVDISSGGLSLVIGADNGSSTRTNAGNKSGRLAMAHYTNAEEPFAIALCDVTSTTNELSIGGGSGACNTATVVKFFTAANNTTVSGSERMRIDSSGNVGIGGPVDNHGGYGRCLQISGIEAALELESSSGYSYVAQNGVDLQIRNVANGTMPFYTNSTERMRIDSAGSLLVNTTAGYGKFTVASTAGTGKVLLDNYATVPTSENVISIYADASRGYIQSYNNGYKDIAICPSGGGLVVGTTSNSRGARLRVEGLETAHFTGYGNGYGIGLWMTPNPSATGGTATPVSFQNVSDATVGSITTNWLLPPLITPPPTTA
jgi:hypothetical protein